MTQLFAVGYGASCLLLLGSWSTATAPTSDAAPVLFAPGVVSTEAVEYAATFSQSGDSVYFTRRASFDHSPAILLSVRTNGSWGEAEALPFTSEEGDEYPSLSADGNRLFFASSRPRAGHPAGDNSAWVSERRADGWSEAEPVAIRGAEGSMVSHPAVGPDGYLYFHGRLPGGAGRVDAYRAPKAASDFGPAEPMPFNTPSVEGEVAVAPDGSWLVMYSDRDGGIGAGDLYAANANGDSWSEPRNLGPDVNTPAWEWTPSFSPGGTHLYFARLNSAFDRSDIYVVPSAEVR